MEGYEARNIWNQVAFIGHFLKFKRKVTVK